MESKILDGDQPFRQGERQLPVKVGDFWAWALSRLLADGPRGDLAEFIVNTALGTDMTVPKRGWGECDIIYRGKRIEVKCSSVLQEWERADPSKPTWGIAKTMPCDVALVDGKFKFIGRDKEAIPERRSEVYVFCLFAEKNREIADPLDFDQWEFYVAPTRVINEKLGNQRQISICGLQKIGAAPCTYSDLKAAVDECLV